MITPIFSNTQSLSSTIRYNGIQSWNTGNVSSAETAVRQVMVGSGTLQNFYGVLQSAPGAGKSRTFTVYKNGSATALSFTIADAATIGNDTTHSVSYVAGDLLSVASTFVSTPLSSQFAFGLEVDQVGQPLLTSDAAALGGTTTEYLPLQSGVKSTTAPTVGSIIPTGGTISAAYFNLSGNAGSGKSYTATLMVNGAASALTVAITGTTQTQNSDLTHSVAVSAGDSVYWRIVPAGTPTSRFGSISALFTPTVNGESIQTMASVTAPSTTVANYNGVGGTGAWSTTESIKGVLSASTATLKKLYVVLANAPGGSASYTYTIRSNAADSTVASAVTAAATSGNDTTHSGSVAPGQYVSVKSAPASTPASAVVGWGFVTYVAPASTANSNFFAFF